RAVVRHDSGDDKFTRAAIYVGGRHWKSARGEHLACIALRFSDAGPPAEGPRPPGADRYVSLQAPFTGEVRNRPSPDPTQDGTGLWYSPPPADRPFRTLDLVVTDDAVEGWWDGKRVGTITVQKAAAWLDRNVAGFLELEPSGNDPHPFHGGVGCIIHNG